MKRLACTILATVATAAIAYPLSASAGEIHNRLVNQQQRIYQGVKNGTVSGAEYRNLQRREASVAAMRYRYIKTGGSLTDRERAILNYRLNNISKSIYRDKHD
jgi:hypothetical protein